MNILEEFKKDFLLFIEAGFIAINQTDEDSAIKLLKGAEILDPKNPLIKIGYGYLSLHKLELKNAINSFESVLKSDPHNEMAKTFLGIAQTLSPKDMSKGEKNLKETLKSDDKGIKKLANMALEFVDKIIKKEPTPVNIKKKGK